MHNECTGACIYLYLKPFFLCVVLYTPECVVMNKTEIFPPLACLLLVLFYVSYILDVEIERVPSSEELINFFIYKFLHFHSKNIVFLVGVK